MQDHSGAPHPPSPNAAVWCEAGALTAAALSAQAAALVLTKVAQSRPC